MSDNTNTDTTPWRLDMGLEAARTVAGVDYLEGESGDLVGRNGITLQVAPMVVFFRRYPDSILPLHTHRVSALSLDLVAHVVTQRSQETVASVWAWLLRSNYRLGSYGWNELTLGMQQDLMHSNLLPLELKSFGDWITAPAADFQIVTTERVWGLLS